MKTLCALALGLALSSSATVVRANPAPLDPTIILRDPICNTTNPCFIATGGSFGLQVENDGGGVFDILNSTGFTWTSLTFSLLAPSNESIFGCDGGPFFQNCTIGVTGPGSVPGTNMVDAFFSGLGPCGPSGLINCDGLPTGSGILVSLDPHCTNTSACGSWQPNSVATVSPNPEPETFVLLLTGFLPLLPFRKRLFNSRSSA
ncbi:MAG: hypothetical protein ACYDCM_11830 [Candidatus Acidiferrales bacterium]